MDLIESNFAKYVVNIQDIAPANFVDFSESEDNEIWLKLFAALNVNLEKEFVPRYVFDIIKKDEDIKIGFLTLRTVLTKKLLMRGGHIGYEIEEKYRGYYYASKAIDLLKPFIKKILDGKIMITCDEDNMASRKTIERSGGNLIKIFNPMTAEENNFIKNCCYYMLCC